MICILLIWIININFAFILATSVSFFIISATIWALFYPKKIFYLIFSPLKYLLSVSKMKSFLTIYSWVEDLNMNLSQNYSFNERCLIILFNFLHIFFGSVAIYYLMMACGLAGTLFISMVIFSSLSWGKMIFGFTIAGLGTSEAIVSMIIFLSLAVSLEVAVQQGIITRVLFLAINVIVPLILIFISYYLTKPNELEKKY